VDQGTTKGFKRKEEETRGTQPIEGGSNHLKVTTSCQSPHFGKIPEIESISKPPLPIELYTICQNVSLDYFRK
jgi:hypothetical protein